MFFIPFIQNILFVNIGGQLLLTGNRSNDITHVLDQFGANILENLIPVHINKTSTQHVLSLAESHGIALMIFYTIVREILFYRCSYYVSSC